MPGLQPILFGSLGISLGIMMLFFPETNGRKLAETPEEWPKWYRGELDTDSCTQKKKTEKPVNFNENIRLEDCAYDNYVIYM